MKLKTTILGILLTMGASACTETGQKNEPVSLSPQHAQPAQVASPNQTPVAATPAAAQAKTPDPNAVANDFPTIPNGAQYTLLCLSISTPTHVFDANHVREALVRKTHSNQWYVIHSDSESSIYYGFYKTYADDDQPQEKARAQADRKRIAAMQDDNGDTPFVTCAFQAIPSADPDAPPEWDLRNANGYWSLQIAAYRGSPERKKMAVDAVRQARSEGIQAYYYHGASISSVLIGAWPREAVKEQDSNEAKPADRGNSPIVMPQPLEQNMKTDGLLLPDGTKGVPMVARVEPQDPTLIEAMRKYPYNAVNGDVIYHKVKTKTGEDVKEASPSFLVVIPHRNDDAPADVGTADQAPPPAIPTGNPFAPGAVDPGPGISVGPGQPPARGNGG